MQETADLIGRSRQEIHRWENRYNPSDEVVEQLATALNIKRYN